MDLPPNEGSAQFGENPYFLDWQDNHNCTIEVAWDEVECKFAITYHEGPQRENGNASSEDASSTLPMNIVQTAEATDEAMAGDIAGAVEGVVTAIDITNNQNGQGDPAMAFPEDQFSAPTHSTELEGDELEGDELEGDELKEDELEGDELEEDELEGDELEEDELEGDELEEDELEGDELEEDELEGHELEGDELEVDELEGDELEGDELEGDELEEDELEGDELEVDELEGDELEVDELEGDELEGDELEGDELEGDELEGDELEGDELEGDELEEDELEEDELQGASDFQRVPTRAQEMLMWYQSLPANKIAEVNSGFSDPEAAAAAAAAIAAATAPAGDVSMLQGNGDGEENELLSQSEEPSASLFFKLPWSGEEENCLEYQQDELELDLEIQVDTEDPEAIPRLTELVLTPEMSEAAAAAAQQRRSWTGLFSFQDLQAIHLQLSALFPELEPCLPSFPDDMWLATFIANPERFPSYLDSLCNHLQAYFDFALMVCGPAFLFRVLFGEEAEAQSRVPQMNPQFSRSLLHLPLGNVQQDPASTSRMMPYPDSCCDVDQNSEQDPDSRGNGGGPGAGGPSGGCEGAGF